MEYKRNNELNAKFESRKKLSRLKIRTPMLIQASKLYTPTIFEAFHSEYERSMAGYITALEGKNEYLVAIESLDENFTLRRSTKLLVILQTKPIHAAMDSSIESEYCVACSKSP
jgi:hypothetical protein